MVRTIRTCSAAALALLVSMPARADVPDALAAYVRARAADADGRAEDAAAAYGAALAADPANPVIASRAWREALTAGDLSLARRASAVLVEAGVAPVDSAVLALADAVAAKRPDAARAAADRLANGPLDFLGDAARRWLDFARGETPFPPASDNPLARRIGAEQDALLTIARGDTAGGLAAVRGVLIANAGSLEFRFAAAEFLAGKGRRDEARALLGGFDPVIVSARERLRGGTKPTAATGIARLYTRVAGELIGGEARTLAITLTRAALVLDPDDDRARILLADALSRDAATERALGVLANVRAKSIHAAGALSMRVSVLTRAGEGERAVAAAERLAADDTGSGASAQRLGDILASQGAYRAAAAAYGRAIARPGGAEDWTLYLNRGGAFDEAGDWPAARADLERAVALAPAEPLALNYLGYARIERGEDAAAARALLERAVSLAPDDGNIADSLGWAWVKAGEPAKGLPYLETAARALPADATIHEHLGDAYWALGRRYEARYAWRAAAVASEGGEATRLATKIERGPDA